MPPQRPYQSRKALNLALRLNHPSISQPASFLEIVFYGHQETHVYLLPRGFGSKWVRWITTTRFRTVGESKSRSARLILTWFEQPSRERLIFDQIKKLTVSLFVDTFDFRVNKPSGDTRKRSWNMTRYNHIPPTKYWLNRSVGVVCDERNGCDFVGTLGYAGRRDEWS